MSDSAKRPSLITSATDAVHATLIGFTDTITAVSAGTTSAARIYSTTMSYAEASNAAWAAEGMSNFSTEQRAFIKLVNADLKLPPEAPTNGNTSVTTTE